MLPTHLTYASAESITGGRVQSFFTTESGSSNYFVGGICAYSTDIKISVLGVTESVARETNSVCEQVAKEMALGCRELFGADVSIATTGYVQGFKFDGEEFKPVAHVAVFIAGQLPIHTITLHPPVDGTREENLKYVTEETLKFVESVVQ